MITLKEVDYKSFGKCLEISNGTINVKITLNVGPRIIYLGTNDGVNLMYEDTDDLINKSGEYFDKNYKKGEAWHIYGGHRLWKSPEDLASYFPDNYPVEVKKLDNGAIFTSLKECTTGIQKSIQITMNDLGEITLTHKFFNFTKETVSYSLWGLSVMNKGGIGYVPMSKEDTGLLANRNLVIWPYTNIKDERIDLRQDALVVKQDPSATSAIKFGMLNTEGVAYYMYFDTLLEKRFEKGKRDGNYADYCSNMEIYTNGIMMEIETLSEIKEIKQNTTCEQVEVWILHNKNSAEYIKIKEKIENK